MTTPQTVAGAIRARLLDVFPELQVFRNEAPEGTETPVVVITDGLNVQGEDLGDDLLLTEQVQVDLYLDYAQVTNWADQIHAALHRAPISVPGSQIHRCLVTERINQPADAGNEDGVERITFTVLVRRRMSATEYGTLPIQPTPTLLEEHAAQTLNVHGIANTAELETQTGAQAKADNALIAANAYTDAALEDINVPDLSLYETIIGAQAKADAAEADANTYTDNSIAAIPPVDLSSYETIVGAQAKADTAESNANTYTDNSIAAIPPVDLSSYETIVGAQAKADAAESDAVVTANAYTDAAILAIPPVDLSAYETIVGAQAKADAAEADAILASNAYTDQEVVDLTNGTTDFESAQFNTTTALTAGVGELTWNSAEGTLDLGLLGGNITLQVGQETVQHINNRTGSALTLGQAVYVSGSQGNRLTVDLALATNDTLSARTFGIVSEPIANNQSGFITTSGIVHNMNTSAFPEGTAVFLSPTVPGGLTATRPVAPNHGVLVGWCVRQHATIGMLFVHVQNGFELGELHNVLTNGTTDGQVLTYEAATSLWKPKTPSAGGASTFKGVWSSTKTFAIGDTCIHNGQTYIATAPSTNSIPANTLEGGYKADGLTRSPVVYAEFDDEPGVITLKNSGSHTATAIAMQGGVFQSGTPLFGGNDNASAAMASNRLPYIPHSATLANLPVTGFTVEFIARIGSVVAGGSGLVSYYGTGVAGGFLIWTSGNFVQVAVIKNGAFPLYTSSLATVGDGLTHHYSMVWDGTNVRLYIDGIQRAFGTPASGYQPPTVGNLALKKLADSLATADSFNGRISHLATYPTAFSAPTVASRAALWQQATPNTGWAIY